MRRLLRSASGRRRARVCKDSSCLRNVGQRFAQRREIVVANARMGFLLAWVLRRRNPRRVSGVRLQGRFPKRQSDGRQSLNALLLEELLDALDRVAFVVQETLDEPQPLDVVRAIIA